MAQHFKDLVAWQKAMDLVVAIYSVSERFPKRETYSLADQIRRAAVSVPSNIAEGQAHFSRKEFHHFLHHSRGSLAEVETQVMIAQRLHYVSSTDAESLLAKVSEVGRIINGLIGSIDKSVSSLRVGNR
jgi:four helix bundle protein